MCDLRYQTSGSPCTAQGKGRDRTDNLSELVPRCPSTLETLDGVLSVVFVLVELGGDQVRGAGQRHIRGPRESALQVPFQDASA